jgi:2-oxoglutarate ferredoxin oxidoreductase subunit gamma
VHQLRPGGLLIVNSSLPIDHELPATARVVRVPALDLANELASEKAVNMVMLGAYVAASGIVPLESIGETLRKLLPERHHKLMPANLAAIEGGAKAAQAS